MKSAGRSRCEWRETALMLELLCRANLPRLSLRDAFLQWKDISHKLAKPSRQRVRQRAQFHYPLG